MKTTGKTWKELEKAAMEISGLSLMCHLGARLHIYTFLNVKRRGTPWLTNNLSDCSVASRVVVMVQWLAHTTSNPGDAGSIPT